MKRGFTLVELIIAVAVFTVVMTLSLGALLVLSVSTQKAQALKTVVTNLNFALDSMTRSIRTGIDYHCDPTYPLSGVADCAYPNGGTSIGFVDAQGRKVSFRFNPSCSGGTGCIERTLDASVGSGSIVWEEFTAPEVIITDLKFYVVGSGLGSSGDKVQPKVTTTIRGYVQTPDTQGSGASQADPFNDPNSFNIQTTVTQRLYDQ